MSPIKLWAIAKTPCPSREANAGSAGWSTDAIKPNPKMFNARLRSAKRTPIIVEISIPKAGPFTLLDAEAPPP